MKRRDIVLSLVLAIPWAAAGCAAGGSAGEYSPAPYDAGANGGAGRCFGANDCPPNYTCNTFGACVPLSQGEAPADAGTPLPPEVQAKIDAPASGKRFVYVAIPAGDNVVKIDSSTLAVETIGVGRDPGPLRTVPGQDTALVLNKRSNTLTILRAKDGGGDTLTTLPATAGLNQVSMSPTGKFAIAWFDLDASGGSLAPKQSFQEITLVQLDAGSEQATKLSIGFHPTDVQWSPRGDAAWIVTDQGLSIIPLAPPPKAGVVRTVPLVANLLSDKPPTLVRVTADGKRALALPPGGTSVRSVALDTGAIDDVDLGSAPTDLDLTPDGAIALVTLRDAKEVALVHLPADLADPTGITRVATAGYVAGQAVLTADGAHALLFTNAIAQKVMLVLDLGAPPKLRALPLNKSVRNVLVAPDGKSALIVHNKVPGTPSPMDPLPDYLDKLQGYSLFNVDTGFAKLQPTDAAPGPSAFAPGGGSAYLLLRDDSLRVRSVEALDLRTFLVSSVPLGSPPVAVGVVPASPLVFVAQEHPLGRMTFVDTDTFKTRTLTGFALNGGIIE